MKDVDSAREQRWESWDGTSSERQVFVIESGDASWTLTGKKGWKGEKGRN